MRAIELAHASAERNPSRLAAFLYFYNRTPLSLKWKERFPHERAVTRFLGIGADGAWPNHRSIVHVPSLSSKSGNNFGPTWMYWSIGMRSADWSRNSGRFKVYLSPLIDDLPAVVDDLGSLANDSGAHALKIGGNVQGLLRPDKFMVYFGDLGNAVVFARSLLSRIQVCRAHGVPFSHPIGREGLVSVGFDPPATALWTQKKEGPSWRLWVANCIARAILRTRRLNSNDPIKSIVAEIERQNIDPYMWRPLNSIWESQWGRRRHAL